MRLLICGLATVALLGVRPVCARGPAWSYLESQYTWSWPQLDEPGSGWNIQGSVPIDDTFYVMGFAENIIASYDTIDVDERFSIGTVSAGAHAGSGAGQVFMQFTWADKTRTRFESGMRTESDHGSGLGGALGARWMPLSWISIEPQYGIKGYVFDGFTKLDVALRIIPHVWLVGTFNHGLFSGNEYDAGLRWNWSDYTYKASELPGARFVSSAGRTLKKGQRMVAVRELVPQVRPAAGAPELTPIPEGAEFALEEATDNRFGTWWRIGADGWIREYDLVGVRD